MEFIFTRRIHFRQIWTKILKLSVKLRFGMKTNSNRLNAEFDGDVHYCRFGLKRLSWTNSVQKSTLSI